MNYSHVFLNSSAKRHGKQVSDVLFIGCSRLPRQSMTGALSRGIGLQSLYLVPSALSEAWSQMTLRATAISSIVPSNTLTI